MSLSEPGPTRAGQKKQPLIIRWATAFSYTVAVVGLLVATGAGLAVNGVPPDEPGAAAIKNQLRLSAIIGFSIGLLAGVFTYKARKAVLWARFALILLHALLAAFALFLIPIASEAGYQGVVLLLGIVVLAVGGCALWASKQTGAWFDRLNGKTASGTQR